MPTKLRNLVINRVDLVDVGANLDMETGDGAHVLLWKRHDGDLPQSDPEPDPEPEPEDTDMPDIEKVGRKIAGKRRARLEAALAELQAVLAETEVEEADAEPTSKRQEETVDDITKGLPEDVAKRMEQLEKRAQEAESAAAAAQEVAKAERDARLRIGFVEKIKGFARLPLDPEKDADLLKKMAESLTTEEYARVEEILRSADAALEKSAAFEAIGSGKTPAVSGSAYAAIEAEAKALVEKGTAKNLPEGISQVALAKPELYAKHLAEMRDR